MALQKSVEMNSKIYFYTFALAKKGKTTIRKSHEIDQLNLISARTQKVYI
jgi:hypothetical protein